MHKKCPIKTENKETHRFYIDKHINTVELWTVALATIEKKKVGTR